MPFARGENRSVLGAFGPEGMTAVYMTAVYQKLGSIKRDDFETFLLDHLLPRLPRESVLVLDNARIHHGGNLAALVEVAGSKLLHLPPYSPDFSPIELDSRWLKGWVRKRRPRTDEERQCCIAQAVQEMPTQHAKPWFRKCGYTQW